MTRLGSILSMEEGKRIVKIGSKNKTGQIIGQIIIGHIIASKRKITVK